MLGSDQTLYDVPRGIRTRWASAENWDGREGDGGRTCNGRKGSPCFRLHCGESKVLAEATGSSGTLRRFWVTMSDRSFAMLRGVRVNMYWDAAPTPAVSAPIGDLFGHGIGRMAAFESAFLSSPEARSFNCCIPMPFRTGMKVVVTNETDRDQGMFFYDVNYTLGDRHDDDMCYLHAHWRRENPTTIGQDYEFLPRVEGRGRFLGVNAGVIADTDTYFDSWWGEGEFKAYLDDDTDYPTLCGTGTEDYTGTGWGLGPYAERHQGCTIADRTAMQYAFYRWHLPDPLYFATSIRTTMHQIGCWGPGNIQKLRDAGRPLTSVPDGGPVDLNKAAEDNGYGLFERSDDWSSCCYFYLDRPESGLPELADLTCRTEGLQQFGEPERREDAG